MARKLVCAMFVMVVSIGFVFAEEFQGNITKVEGDKITFQKTKKGKSDGDAVVYTTNKDATIAKGKFNKDDKKFTAGDKIEDGLKNEIFTKIGDKGLAVRVTVDGDKCSQILVTGGKKKKDAAN